MRFIARFGVYISGVMVEGGRWTWRGASMNLAIDAISILFVCHVHLDLIEC